MSRCIVYSQFWSARYIRMGGNMKIPVLELQKLQICKVLSKYVCHTLYCSKET